MASNNQAQQLNVAVNPTLPLIKNSAGLSATLTDVFLGPVSLDWSWDITGRLFYRVSEHGRYQDMCCKIKSGSIAEHNVGKEIIDDIKKIFR
jgi:hypothetical protein